MITKTMEDYLENVFHMESEGLVPTTQEMAKHLKISPASVSENLKKLADAGYLTYTPYKGVKLSLKGKKIAIDVVRRHRLSERFLVDKLGIKWEDVHEQAHKLEHGITKIVEDKMYDMLGKPKTCPHGNPVPSLEGEVKEEKSYPLSTFNKNDKVKIIKITEESSEYLCYLATLGVMPKTEIRIEEKAPFNGPIMIKMGATTYALGRNIANSIWGKKI